MDANLFSASLKHIIIRDRGLESYTEYAGYQITDTNAIVETVRNTLTSIPFAFGSCVMISTGLVAALRAQGIPGVVILGDLVLNGGYVFQCRENIPVPTFDGEIIEKVWDGHAWAMVGEILFDLSVFRSAYAIEQPSRLKAFVLDSFGTGKGALMSTVHQLPPRMSFVPHYALDDDRIYGVLEGLSRQAKSLKA